MSQISNLNQIGGNFAPNSVDYECKQQIVCDTDTNTTLYQYISLQNGVPTGAVTYTDTAGVAATAPTNFTVGCCIIEKVADATTVRNTADILTTGTINLMATDVDGTVTVDTYREVVVHNRGMFDIEITGTTDNAGTFAFTVPAMGTGSYSLPVNPNGGTISTLLAQADATAPFSGTVTAGNVIVNYSN
jgi:hypothetical protein